MTNVECCMKWGLTPGLLLFPVSVPISQARTDTDNINDVGVSPRFWASPAPRSRYAGRSGVTEDGRIVRMKNCF